MQIFIEAIDLNIWEAIEIGPYIPTLVVGNATIEKPRDWGDQEEESWGCCGDGGDAGEGVGDSARESPAYVC